MQDTALASFAVSIILIPSDFYPTTAVQYKSAFPHWAGRPSPGSGRILRCRYADVVNYFI